MREVSLKKNFALLTVGEIAPGVLFVFLLPIYTRFLTAADFGLVATLGLLAAFVRRMTNLGYDWVLRARYFLAKSEEDRHKLVGTLLALGTVVRTIIVAAILAMASWILPVLFPAWNNTYTLSLVVLSVFLVLEHAYQLFLDTATLEKRAAAVCAARIVWIVVTAALTLILLIPLSQGVVSIYWGQLGGLVVSFALFALPRLYRGLAPAMSSNVICDVRRIGFPAWPQGLSLYLGKFADRYFVQYFLGPAALGLYSIGTRFREAVMLLHVSFKSTTLPEICRCVSLQVPSRELGRWVLLSTTATTLGLLPAIAFSREIVRLMTGPEFWDAYKVMAFLLVLPVNGFLGYSETIIASSGRTRIVAVVNSAMSFLVALALLIAVPRTGLVGTALTLLVLELAWSAIFLALAQKHLQFSSSDYLHLLALIGCALAVAFFSVYVWPDTVFARFAVVLCGAYVVCMLDFANGRVFQRFIANTLGYCLRKARL